jgi:hypothetical protein
MIAAPRRARRRAAAGGCLLLCLGSPALAAEPPCGTERPWVAVEATGQLPARLERDAVVDRLRVELDARKIDLCEARAPDATRPTRRPLATIALDASGGATPEQVSLEIEVSDDVTSKRVARAVDLAGVPVDGRAAVVALAADELLRASWAELALEGARVARRPAPPEVRAAVEPRSAPAAAERTPVSLGVRAAAEWWSAGLPLLGGDAGLAWLAARRLSLELYAGARAAPDEATPSGEISVLAGSVRGGVRLLIQDPADRAALSAAARVSGYWLRISGEAGPGARGDATSQVALAVELVPRLDARIARGLHLALDAGAAVALRGVEANDRGTTVTGLAGVAALTSIGLVVGGP